MACSSCGNRGRIRVSRVADPVAKSDVHRPIKLKQSKLKILRPANNIDKRL